MTTDDLVEVADHAEQAREFLDRCREYLAAGDLHQASEKGWGAAAHMAKAVATAQGWEYNTHADFSGVLNRARRVTDDDRLPGLRGRANDLHGNYYRRKRHLDADSIAEDIEAVAELVEILAPLTTPSS
ncbi:MAG: HEPN domain-containing protein [Chloroflexi bacterium]|nr:HEPN domain-containing protein [Chloroflexota bacterium]MYD65615.1 HEPN domain-containing protein [Chloroflexota bacterium]